MRPAAAAAAPVRPVGAAGAAGSAASRFAVFPPRASPAPRADRTTARPFAALSLGEARERDGAAVPARTGAPGWPGRHASPAAPRRLPRLDAPTPSPGCPAPAAAPPRRAPGLWWSLAMPAAPFALPSSDAGGFPPALPLPPTRETSPVALPAREHELIRPLPPGVGIECNGKRSMGCTFGGTKRKQVGVSGYRRRRLSVGGRKVLRARRAKGRWVLCTSSWRNKRRVRG